VGEITGVKTPASPQSSPPCFPYSDGGVILLFMRLRKMRL